MTVNELIDRLQEIRDKEQTVIDGEFNMVSRIGETDDGYVYIA